MSKFTELFLGGGKTLAPTLATNFFTSRTWTAPQDGIVVIRAMGAGGGGAMGSNATGGYSGSWGAKALKVSKGATVVVTIGAGGAGKSATNGDGSAGGDTTVTVGGITYTAFGGPGGKFNAASMPANGPAQSANWDFGASSVRPGLASGSGVTGGAGVDILSQGNNATTSANSNGSGGGGTGSASSGFDGGGSAPGGRSALGGAPANPGVNFDASNGEWGISFYGGSGGIGGPTTAGAGGNGAGGGGGSSSGGSASGGNGGGGGGSNGGGNGGNGGNGGGGGGTNGTGNGGNGGNGYAHMKFYADMGI